MPNQCKCASSMEGMCRSDSMLAVGEWSRLPVPNAEW